MRAGPRGKRRHTRLLGPAGAWERHPGIDIGSPPGTPVTSPAPGRVVAASSQGGYGKHVTLAHGNGVKSRYAHMKKIDVKTIVDDSFVKSAADRGLDKK